ncbi:MAG: Uncharacterized protein CEO12_27 [Parcubacteria group bacterium Gr01-1014_46]|nr:MAG: Uncharacterized protein CEO12_27 [Parcubacteria group bacterium Gr01-1014_46]
MERDPIQEIERMIRGIHDQMASKAKPVLTRYPLIFAFLVTFGLASILHGFELFTDKMPVFRQNPHYLVIIGIVVLLITGTLYKKLDKGE